MGSGTKSRRTIATEQAVNEPVETQEETRVVIPAKDREPSLRNAIARAKRNLEQEKYSVGETIYDAAYQYYLRQDEMYTLQSAVASYLKKNKYLYTSELRPRYYGETRDDVIDWKILREYMKL